MNKLSSLLYFILILSGCGDNSESKEESPLINAACISNPPAEASEGHDVRYYCREYQAVKADDFSVQAQCRLTDILRGYSAVWKPNETCPLENFIGKCKLTYDGYTFTTFYYTFPDGLSDWPNNASDAEQHCLTGDGGTLAEGIWTAA